MPKGYWIARVDVRDANLDAVHPEGVAIDHAIAAAAGVAQRKGAGRGRPIGAARFRGGRGEHPAARGDGGEQPDFKKIPHGARLTPGWSTKGERTRPGRIVSETEPLRSDTDRDRARMAGVAEGTEPRVEYACERCGGVAVTRDAWAEWHVPSQAWTLSELFDFAFCHQCHRETRLIERFAN